MPVLGFSSIGMKLFPTNESPYFAPAKSINVRAISTELTKFGFTVPALTLAGQRTIQGVRTPLS